MRVENNVRADLKSTSRIDVPTGASTLQIANRRAIIGENIRPDGRYA